MIDERPCPKRQSPSTICAEPPQQGARDYPGPPGWHKTGRKAIEHAGNRYNLKWLLSGRHGDFRPRLTKTGFIQGSLNESSANRILTCRSESPRVNLRQKREAFE